MTAKRVARIGDHCEGFCDGVGHAPHRAFIGTWETGSSTVFADGIGVVRVGDTGITDCSPVHHIRVINGSNVVFADGLSIHRVDDDVEVIEGGTATTTTGSSNVDSI